MGHNPIPPPSVGNQPIIPPPRGTAAKPAEVRGRKTSAGGSSYSRKASASKGVGVGYKPPPPPPPARLPAAYQGDRIPAGSDGWLYHHPVQVVLAITGMFAAGVGAYKLLAHQHGGWPSLGIALVLLCLPLVWRLAGKPDLVGAIDKLGGPMPIVPPPDTRTPTQRMLDEVREAYAKDEIDEAAMEALTVQALALEGVRQQARAAQIANGGMPLPGGLPSPSNTSTH
jgi:hypothetical protein